MELKWAISLIRWVLSGTVLLISLPICQGQSPSELVMWNTQSAPFSKDFELDLKIVELDEHHFQLVSTIDLAEGSYIISPLSKDSFYLPYTHTISKNDSVMPIADLVEFPESVVELDSLIEKKVRLVRTKTVFTQAYKILQQENFIVKGLIEFLVEPSCIPYDLTFDIKNQSGVLTIENEKLIISAEYKR